MALVADFRPFIKLSIATAPNGVVDHSIIRAARKFCERSEAIRVDLAAVDSEAGTAVYTLVPPAGHEIVDVVEVMYEGRKLTPKSHKQLSQMDPEYRTTTGTPYYYVLEGTNQLRLADVPPTAVVGAIEVKAIIKPIVGATDIHDELYDKYLEAITDGACSILFGMKSQAWYDANEARKSEMSFEEKADEARVKVGMSNTKGAGGKVRYGGY